MRGRAQVVAYDGTDFQGMQWQPKARTVQVRARLISSVGWPRLLQSPGTVPRSAAVQPLASIQGRVPPPPPSAPQGELEKGIARVYLGNSRVVGASRTDGGAHAQGQVGASRQASRGATAQPRARITIASRARPRPGMPQAAAVAAAPFALSSPANPSTSDH